MDCGINEGWKLHRSVLALHSVAVEEMMLM